MSVQLVRLEQLVPFIIINAELELISKQKRHRGYLILALSG